MKDRVLLAFSSSAVKAVGRRPHQDGRIAAVLTLRNRQPESLRDVGQALTEAANSCFDRADELEA